MSVNVDITPRAYEPIEKVIKRFTKKCKKEEVIKEFCEKQRFKTRRQRRQEKHLKAKRLRQKRSRN